METKFNFNSQICTTREQSERLLALGLNKDTADMCLCPSVYGIIYQVVQLPESIFAEDETPAWSLGRLLEMVPYCVEMYDKYWCLQVSKGYVRYAYNGMEKSYIGYIQKPNIFDAIIYCIEWLIKEGHFKNKYLIEE